MKHYRLWKTPVHNSSSKGISDQLELNQIWFAPELGFDIFYSLKNAMISFSPFSKIVRIVGFSNSVHRNQPSQKYKRLSELQEFCIKRKMQKMLFPTNTGSDMHGPHLIKVWKRNNN